MLLVIVQLPDRLFFRVVFFEELKGSKMLSQKIDEAGRSMIEMLGVLAIVGVLSVGGIAGYSKAMAKNKNIKLIDQINTLSMNIRTLFSPQRNYKGLDIETIVNLGGAANMQNASANGSSMTLIHAWGGKIAVETVTQKKAGDDQAFLIFADNIPQETCMAIVTSNWGEGGGQTDLVAMMVVNNKRDTAIVYEKLNIPNIEISGNKSNGRWGIFSQNSSKKWRLPAAMETAYEVCNYDDMALIAWKYN